MKAIVWSLLSLAGVFGSTHAEYTFATDYYEVLVDHFNFGTNATFQLKYLYNDSWWDKDGSGPIFFYTGNEGAIELFAQNSGFIWDIAPKFTALILFAEHRYYGTSLPFGNESFSGPSKTGYLTSEQALADFADFLLYYKFHHGGANCPIIAFGGSYGGMLSAWMRIKYPHVIQGAIAASAPIFQFPDLTPCGVYSQILTKAYEKESTHCSQTIRESWKILTEFGQMDAGRHWVSKNWRLCDQLNSTEDMDALKAWLTDSYSNLAMQNYPYKSNFLSPLPPYPVKVFCSKLDSNARVQKGKVLLRSLFKGLTVYFNYTGTTKCLETDQSGTALLGDQGWDYQSCSEMVMPMCSDGVNDMLEASPWNYSAFASACSKRWWGLQPRPWMTQIIYGGKRITEASNIVFSNGLLDPWSGGGVLSNLSDSLVAVIIPEGAHHLDLRGANTADPLSVKAVRRFEIEQIQKWIEEYRK